MSRHRNEVYLVGQLKRLTMLPGMINDGDNPEITVWVADNPLLRWPVHENRGCLLPASHRNSLLESPRALLADHKPKRCCPKNALPRHLVRRGLRRPEIPVPELSTKCAGDAIARLCRNQSAGYR